jgi:hypothetical protein
MNLGMPNSTQHDGAYDSFEIDIWWRRAITPDPFLLVSEWADQYDCSRQNPPPNLAAGALPALRT